MLIGHVHRVIPDLLMLPNVSSFLMHQKTRMNCIQIDHHVHPIEILVTIHRVTSCHTCHAISMIHMAISRHFKATEGKVTYMSRIRHAHISAYITLHRVVSLASIRLPSPKAFRPPNRSRMFRLFRGKKKRDDDSKESDPEAPTGDVQGEAKDAVDIKHGDPDELPSEETGTRDTKEQKRRNRREKHLKDIKAIKRKATQDNRLMREAEQRVQAQALRLKEEESDKKKKYLSLGDIGVTDEIFFGLTLIIKGCLYFLVFFLAVSVAATDADVKNCRTLKLTSKEGICVRQNAVGGEPSNPPEVRSDFFFIQTLCLG
ncbi:hypothetical protein AAMO2058_000816900, partial [Amorphochlora amoebiformis]